MRGSKRSAAVAGVLALAASGLAQAIEWNLQPAASAMAADIHWLHEAVMVLGTLIFIGVFSFMFYTCYANRKTKSHPAPPFPEKTTVEIVWSVMPAILLAAIG